MIKLETAHIEEVRGIRKLDIDFRKDTFAISGPNGSGKSGVMDAIEFGLTGQIGRLSLVAFSKMLDLMARNASREADRLDKLEAPARELARQKKQADEARAYGLCAMLIGSGYSGLWHFFI